MNQLHADTIESLVDVLHQHQQINAAATALAVQPEPEPEIKPMPAPSELVREQLQPETEHQSEAI